MEELFQEQTLSGPISSPTTPLLKLEQVTLQAGTGDRALLRNLALTLAAGERVVLVGHAGSGKTLLFRLLAGLLSPTQGQIVFGGQPTTQIPGPELRRQVAWVPRSPRLLGQTVKETMTYPLRLQSISDAELQQRLETVLTALNLPLEWLPTTAADLTLLQQWWVTLGRALITQPSVLLLELPVELSAQPKEASGENGDASDANILHRVLSLYQTQGVAMILASQNFSELLFRSAHQIFVLSQGQLQPINAENPAAALEAWMAKVAKKNAEDEDWGED